MVTENPQIALMGATGNCGRPAVECLLKNKVPIRLISRNIKKAEEFFNRLENSHLINYFECPDYLEHPDLIRKALKGIKRLAINPPTSPKRSEITQLIISIAKEVKVEYIVLISIPEAQKKEILFQRQFAEMEEALRSSMIPHTILRVMFFMENFILDLPDIKNNEKLVQSLHKGSFCPISVKDIGRCEAQVLMNPTDHQNRTYLLTGPESFTGNDLAHSLSIYMGKPVEYSDINSTQLSHKLETNKNVDKWMAQGIGELMEEFSKNLVKNPTNDVYNIIHQPSTTFSQVLQAHRCEMLKPTMA